MFRDLIIGLVIVFMAGSVILNIIYRKAGFNKSQQLTEDKQSSNLESDNIESNR
jgi:hypothetical protein